jgi:hypothetical protein
MAAVKLCHKKMAAEKASSHRRGFSQKRSDLKSRIPLLQQTTKLKKEKSFAKAVKSK